MGLIHRANRIQEKKKSTPKENTVSKHEYFVTTLDFFCLEHNIDRAFLLYSDGILIYPVFSRGFDLTSSKRYVMTLLDYKKKFKSDFSTFEKKDFNELRTFFSSKEWDSLLRLDSIKISNTIYFFRAHSSLDINKNINNIEQVNYSFFDTFIDNNIFDLLDLMVNQNLKSKNNEAIKEQLIALSKQNKKMLLFAVDLSEVFNNLLHFSLNFNDQLLYNVILNLLLKTIGNACIYKIKDTFLIHFILFTNQTINANLYFNSLLNSLESFFDPTITSKIIIKKDSEIENPTITKSIDFLFGV